MTEGQPLITEEMIRDQMKVVGVPDDIAEETLRRLWYGTAQDAIQDAIDYLASSGWGQALQQSN